LVIEHWTLVIPYVELGLETRPTTDIF
jgi:hypothetical protein